MKRSIWLVVLVLVAIIAIANGMYSATPTAKITNSPIAKSQPPSKSPQVVSTPSVSPQKLLTHIQKLNFQRYTPEARSRARTYITKSLQKFGWTPQLQAFTGGINIIAQRAGTNPESGTILVGAHYDTVAVSPGADDNSTGVAVLLELARLMADYPTPRTLQLAFFDEEEVGLLGSRAFVTPETHLSLQGAIIMDMIGFTCHTTGCQKYPTGLPVSPPSDKGEFLAAVVDSEHASLLDAFKISQSIPPVFTLPIPFKGVLTPDSLRSDHAPFWYAGIGAVLVTDTANLRNPHYHRATDIPATLERSFFTNSAQVVVNATTVLLKSSDSA
jgi:Peptidase family M28